MDDESRWIDKWHRLGKWRWALVAVMVIGISAAVGALVWGSDDGDTTTTGPGPSTTMERSTTTVGSESTSTSVSPTTTATTAPDTTTTTARSSTSTTARQTTIPGIPTEVSARTGGGSGEVELDWNAVSGATGYRVLRSGSAGGPFDVVADFNVATGATTAADDVVNIWSQQHSYVPERGRLDGPDRSPSFQYVDVGGPGQRCYEVIAYNAAGAGRASAVACGSPPS